MAESMLRVERRMTFHMLLLISYEIFQKKVNSQDLFIVCLPDNVRMIKFL